ncbi:hypothetical protein QJQ45_006227 [Haematococcus lacustris]|nr:hypothetical protein QJQ45_006227 [Haematococcus lacustris]
MQLKEEAVIVSQWRLGTRKQLVVFFGNAGIGMRGGGWRAKAVLQACRKVVKRPNSGKPPDRVPGKVVTVDAFRTNRVSSAMNSPQPCEEKLDRSEPEGWRPPAGQVQNRLLRSAWSKRFEAAVRGLMLCTGQGPLGAFLAEEGAAWEPAAVARLNKPSYRLTPGERATHLRPLPAQRHEAQGQARGQEQGGARAVGRGGGRARGRVLQVDGELAGRPVSLVCVYAPAQQAERPAFCAECLPACLPPAADRRLLLMGGDFNCILAPVDRVGIPQGSQHGEAWVGSRGQGAEQLRQLVGERGLVDPWRHLHPSKRDLTHFSERWQTDARLDRWYISEEQVQWQMDSAIHGELLHCQAGKADSRAPDQWRGRLGCSATDPAPPSPPAALTHTLSTLGQPRTGPATESPQKALL